MIIALCVIAGFYAMLCSRERRLLPGYEFALNFLYIPAALVVMETWNGYREEQGVEHHENLLLHRLYQLDVLGAWTGWTIGFFSIAMTALGRWDYDWLWAVWGTFVIGVAIKRFALRRGEPGANFALSVAGIALGGQSLPTLLIAALVYAVADPILDRIGTKLEENKQARQH